MEFYVQMNKNLLSITFTYQKLFIKLQIPLSISSKSQDFKEIFNFLILIILGV